MKGLQWVDECLSWIAPPRCEACGAVDAEHGLCRRCVQELPWNRSCCPRCAQPLTVSTLCRRCVKRAPAFDSACAAFRHEGAAQQGVVRLKYAARFEQSRRLGGLMAQQLAARPQPLPQLLIPVPLPRWRLYRRGYNQALEIARALARVLAIEVDAGAARLLRVPADQIGQSAAQRRRNLRGAFVVQRPLQGLHIALVDDVMTTGATLDALAQAARKAGAARIEAWALARAP